MNGPYSTSREALLLASLLVGLLEGFYANCSRIEGRAALLRGLAAQQRRPTNLPQWLRHYLNSSDFALPASASDAPFIDRIGFSSTRLRSEPGS
jgi:hypothetical protein